MKNILAIDPGAKGGVASFEKGNITAFPIDSELSNNVGRLVRAQPSSWVCYLEQVGGYIGDEEKATGSRMFVFGESYGFAKGMCAAFGVHVRLVRPQLWQRGIPNRVGSYGDRKRALKAWAQQCFPALTVTLSTADALCILHYAQRYGETSSLDAKHEAAIAWCKSQGYAVPAFGSDSFKQMFAYWCLLQKNGANG